MTALKIAPEDHLREVVAHTHTDMKVALKMLRRMRWIAAWRKLEQGYNRLGKALDAGRPGA